MNSNIKNLLVNGCHIVHQQVYFISKALNCTIISEVVICSSLLRNLQVRPYVLLYNMLFTSDKLSSVPETDRAGSEDFPPLRICFQDLAIVPGIGNFNGELIFLHIRFCCKILLIMVITLLIFMDYSLSAPAVIA